MNWLIFVALAVTFDSLRIFIDNYTSDVYFKGRDSVAQKLFYGWVNVIAGPLLLIVLGFSMTMEHLPLAGFLILSGALSSIAGIPYYKALEIDDSTNLGIFTQLAPVMYLILGWFFLDEEFSPAQLIAFAIIIAAPVLIILTTKKNSRKVKLRAVFLAFLYVLIAVIGNLIFVKADDAANWNLFEELALVFIGRGLANIVIVYTRPKWHKRFKRVLKSSNKRVLRPLIANSIVGFIKDIGYRGALITAPAVALASAASDAVEPIVIFFMGIVLTLIWPKFGREKLNRKSVMVHLAATILVVIGISILQM